MLEGADSEKVSFFTSPPCPPMKFPFTKTYFLLYISKKGMISNLQIDKKGEVKKMFNELRDFLDYLRKNNRLWEVNTEVDPKWELGAICRENFNKMGYGFIFKKIKGFHTPLVTGVFGCSRDIYADVLRCDPSTEEVQKRWQEFYKKLIKPRIVDRNEASCKEIIIEKKEVDLYADPFPVPTWHYLDGGPYLGTLHAIITQDPRTGWINLGVYRNQILDKNVLGCQVQGSKHIGMHWAKWRELGKPMPVAIAIGLDPYLIITSTTAIPAQIDEYDIAGAIKGAPIEVVKAETSDLLVPAFAEIVIEGEMPIDSFWPEEGPVGEFTGFMGEKSNDSPYIKIKKVTHRKNPYFQGTYEGRPPSESNILRSIGKSTALYEHLLRSGCPGVKDVCVTPAGGAGLHAVVSIKKSFPGHIRCVMGLMWGYPGFSCKHVVVVNDDIDVWDAAMVEWAIATRVQASRDITIVTGGRTSILDPSQVPSKRPWSDWLGIDATNPVDEYRWDGSVMPPYADMFPIELLERIRSRWDSYFE
jgi:UbiD family decarboxylase